MSWQDRYGRGLVEDRCFQHWNGSGQLMALGWHGTGIVHRKGIVSREMAQQIEQELSAYDGQGMEEIGT
jgi:hypothetical protein